MVTVPRFILHVAAVFMPRVRSNLSVDAGDLYRDRRDWVNAARCYRRALKICPDRWPIWVQLGHALKENGDRNEALAAYQQAAAQPGHDGDATLHCGIMAWQLGHFAEAKTVLRQAAALMPTRTDVRNAFLELLHDPLAVDERARQAANGLTVAEAARLESALVDGGVQLVFDASDLVSYFRHSRLPTGIQRVQMEVIRAAFAIHPGVQVGCFSDLAGKWLRIPAAQFQTLCTLSVSSGDRHGSAWIDALETLAATLAAQTPVVFAPGAFLVNLGTSWWLKNYFLHVRNARQAFGIHHVPFVHDFIPAITPEHCIRELTQDFLSWAYDVFNNAEFFLVNSRATRDDLFRVADILGHDVAASHVAVVPLDADFRRPDIAEAPLEQLAQWNIAPGAFVLFVSTIESRKNHRMAFQAWRELIARHGADQIPDLVCVGNRGWLNDHVYAMLDEDPVLAAKVRMLSHLSDDQLMLLYRRCRFTLYPSSYEGWGLPVTEALCYGKVSLLCRQSSLPEAGGDFAMYFEPDDLPGLVKAAETLIFDHAARFAREEHIRDHFVARSWAGVTGQIIAEINNFASIANGSAGKMANPPITLDRLYRMIRTVRTELVRGSDEGEQLRSGGGWWEPEDWGCATRPGGGEIGFRVAADLAQVRCWLRLAGPDGQHSEVTIRCGDRELRCDLPAGTWRWVSFVADVVGGNVQFAIHGQLCVDMTIKTGYRDRRTISVGLGGLIVTAAEHVRSLIDVSQAIATQEMCADRFARDAHLILLNRTADQSELPDHALVEMERLGRSQFIERLSNSTEYGQTSDQVVMFDQGIRHP